MRLLRSSFQKETLIQDDLLYLYKVNAVWHLYLYESSLGAREAYLFLQAKLSETLIRAWHMSDDECEHYGHWSVYIINATLNDLLNQYLATTNHNVENIV